MSFVLRSYWRSSCSWRVRIGLNMKGISYETVSVHLVQDGGQQHTAEHRELNPMRELPVLLVDGEPIAQSMGILEYLEENFASPSLLPKDAIERARVRQMSEIINSGIQPIQNLRVMQKLGKDFDLPKEQQIAWSRDWIEFGFDALYVLIEKYSGRYSFGDEVTFVDLCLIPQLYNARRFNVDLEKYPRLLEIEKELNAIQAFADAHPDKQPDAVLT